MYEIELLEKLIKERKKHEKELGRKKRRIDIMVDLETFGVKRDAVIFQIGAVVFDINREKILKYSFNEAVKYDEFPNPSKGVEFDVLQFWKENVSTFEEIQKGAKVKNEEELILKFNHWLNYVSSVEKAEIFLWGNGIAFDNEKLKEKFNEYKLEWIVRFNHDRDVRTYEEIASNKLGIEQYVYTGILTSILNEQYHDAYHDAVAQVEKLFISKMIIDGRIKLDV